MAEGQEGRDSEDLSDEISAHRLEEFREKGQVAQSRELSTLAATFGVVGTLFAMSSTFGGTIMSYLRESLEVSKVLKLDFSQSGVLGGVLTNSLKVGASIVLPIALAGFFIGALASFAQIGSIFSFDPIQPSFDKINPLSGLGRLFSKKHLVETVKILGKAAILFAVVYSTVKKEILASPAQMGSEAVTVLALFGQTAKGVFLPVAVVLTLFAAIDFFVTKRDYNQQLKLTREEAKQEHKEREGDPQIRARIRGLQREVARRRMMASVKKADVIITNPTHIAIAIQYDRDKMAAPRVVAKGADLLAQKIKQVAADAGIPLVENVPLARTLFKTVKVGQHIPRALYQAVAEVLAYVYRLKNRML